VREKLATRIFSGARGFLFHPFFRTNQEYSKALSVPRQRLPTMGTMVIAESNEIGEVGWIRCEFNYVMSMPFISSKGLQISSQRYSL